MRKTRLLAGLAFLVFLGGCGGPADDSPGADEGTDDAAIAPRHPDHVDHATRPFRDFDSPREVREAFAGGTLTFEAEQPFRQLGFMFDAPPNARLEWRRPGDGEWRPVEITWNEADAYVARLVLEHPVRRIELRASTDLDSLYVEFYEDVLAPTPDTERQKSSAEHRVPSAPRKTERPAPSAERQKSSAERRAPSARDEYTTTRQREAPESLVVPREDWGAREPNCRGSRHDPYRMTLHHTASPDDDGGDPARRMRQMQSYHMDNNGWCDIGYHFVVSQSGKIFQGRPTEKRTGAHVGGHNSGNIGISLIGNFDEQTVGSTQFGATIDIVHWVHTTYNITLDREHLKGHTEWSGQGTSCPGANLGARLDELARKAKDGGRQVDWDVAVETELRGTANIYTQGSSKDRPDAMPGDTINAEIYVTNNSPEPVREVWLGYQFAGDHLTPTSYTIYTDHPEYDRQSWTVNDADSAEQNPDKSNLGDRGKLYLFAFSPNETKRIHVELRADTYSAGTTAAPFVRGWVHQIKDVYGPKDGWNADPSTDEIGKQLRAESHVDILSRDQWMFGSEASTDDLEGWTGRGSHERVTLSHNTHSMAMKVTGGDARLLSPDWTRIEADNWDQLVVRFRSHDGAHPLAVYWRGEDQQFADARSMRFELPGDGKFHTYRLPLGDHDDWGGTVTQLRIDPLDGTAPADDAEKWYDVDGLYFRSSTDRTTTADSPFDDGTLLEPIGASDDSDEESDDSSTGDPPGGGDSDSSEDGSGNATDDGLVSRASMENVQVNEGCSIAGSRPNPTPPAWAWLVLVIFVGSTRLPSSALRPLS